MAAEVEVPGSECWWRSLLEWRPRIGCNWLMLVFTQFDCMVPVSWFFTGFVAVSLSLVHIRLAGCDVSGFHVQKNTTSEVFYV